MSTPQEQRTPRTDAEAEISAGDYYLDGTVSVHFARTLEQELSRATQELEQVKRERDILADRVHEMEITVPHSTIIGLNAELATRSAELEQLRASNEALRGALEAARDHLEYCGYGDGWERECAEAQGLSEKIAAALLSTPPASLPVAFPQAVKEACGYLNAFLEYKDLTPGCFDRIRTLISHLQPKENK